MNARPAPEEVTRQGLRHRRAVGLLTLSRRRLGAHEEQRAEQLDRRSSPPKERFAQRGGKLGWVSESEVAVAVIEENRDWLVPPRRADDEVGRIVTIYVARDELQAANGRGQLEELFWTRAELKSNRVMSAQGIKLNEFYPGQIRDAIAVEVSDGEI